MKNDPVNRPSPFYKAIVFSAGMHLLFLSFLLYGNLLPSKSISYNPIYTVNLVSQAPVSSGSEHAVEAEKAPSSPAHTKVPLPKQMILPIEQKAPSKSELLSAIKHINSELKKQQMLHAIQEAVKGSNSSAPAGTNAKQASGGQGSGSGLPSGPAAEEYYASLWQKIHDAWLVPSSMAASSYGYETIIAITIHKDGTITDMSVEKSSGNIYFDQTAIRAIKKASPLPPFPPSWLQNNMDIGIKFSCKEGCK
jgi:TonB family protein